MCVRACVCIRVYVTSHTAQNIVVTWQQHCGDIAMLLQYCYNVTTMFCAVWDVMLRYTLLRSDESRVFGNFEVSFPFSHPSVTSSHPLPAPVADIDDLAETLNSLGEKSSRPFPNLV